ncbi:hypothetical protein Pst134EB_023874 [Puccinia striiformis f. sp. tritici]|nr:hypothetical protein Pst134EB_023874 [Puccinia striiformis f. sp. tritici]
MENYTAVVSVNSVAVTTGHQIGRLTSNLTASPSGSKTGRKLYVPPAPLSIPFTDFPPAKPFLRTSHKQPLASHSSTLRRTLSQTTRPTSRCRLTTLLVLMGKEKGRLLHPTTVVFLTLMIPTHQFSANLLAVQVKSALVPTFFKTRQSVSRLCNLSHTVPLPAMSGLM